MEYREGKLLIDLISHTNNKNYSDTLIDIANIVDFILENNPELTIKAVKRIASILVEAGLNNIEGIGAKEYSLIGTPADLRKEGLTDSADLLEISNKLNRLTSIAYNLEIAYKKELENKSDKA